MSITISYKTGNVRINKLLRFLHITKPIELDEYEKQWVQLIKGNLADKYPNADTFIDTLKPMFIEIYGYSPDERYGEFLNCMYHKLFDLYMKIQYDKSGSNNKLKEIISAASSKYYTREHELPIERVITDLCCKIQNNLYLENGVNRYDLTLKNK